MAEGEFARRLEQAVVERDAIVCGRIADVLRDHGWKCQDIYELVHNLTGIDLPDWDELMCEADRELSQG